MSWSFKSIKAGVIKDIPSYISANFGFEMSAVSGFKMSYPKAGVNADQVVDDTVIVAYWNGVEPYNARWVLRGGEDPDEVEGEEFSAIGKSVLDVFRKVVVEAVVAGQNPTFNTANPGAIIKSLIDAAQARGALTGITYNFTNTVDSNGVPWANAISIEYAIGLKYLDVMFNLFDKGLVEYRMNGYQLQMFNAGTMGVDRSMGAGLVELVAGRDMAEAPKRWSSDDKVKTVLVVGDDKVTLKRTSTAWTGSPFGVEEASVSQGGTKDTGLLTVIGDFALAGTELRRDEYTRKIIFSEASKVPGVDYQVGDWVLERVGQTPVKLRVLSVVIGTDGDGEMSASLRLNDSLLENSIKQARRVDGIIGGAGAASAIPSDNNTEDTTTPNAPTGMSIGSASYVDNRGIAVALVTFDWNAPSTNTDGSVLSDLSDYELQWKLAIEGIYAWRSVVVTDDIAVVGNMQANTSINARVRARDNSGHVSAFSNTAIATTASDVTPPPIPSAPTAVVYLGTVTIIWDGLASGGGGMPLDFHHTNLHRSLTNNFTPSAATVFDTMPTAGRSVVGGQPYGEVWYYKLTTVDGSGNESAGSAQVSATTTKLVSGDLSVGVAGNKSTVSATAPTSPAENDIWIDSANGNIIKVRVGASWVPYQDTAIAAAASAASAAQGTATSAQTTANGKNKVYYSTGLPGTTANSVGDVWFQQSSNVVIGQWVGAGGTSWTSVTMGNLVIAALDAAKITTGTLDANRIAAGSLYVYQTNGLQGTLDAKETPAGAQTKATAAQNAATSAAATDATTKANNAVNTAVLNVKTLWGHPLNSTLIDGGDIYTKSIKASSLLLSDFTNYVVDGDLTDPTFSNWSSAFGVPALLLRTAPSGTTPGYITFSTAANSNVMVINSHIFAARPGEQFYIDLEYSTPATNTVAVNLSPTIFTFEAGGAGITWTGTGSWSAPPNTGWTRAKGYAVVPAGNAASARLDLLFGSGATANQKMSFRNISLRRMNGGELTVDGSVTTSMLAAGSVVTNTLAANAVTVDKMAANSVTTNALVAGSVTSVILSATAIDGKLITGATLRTAATGARVELNLSGLVAYDSSGNLKTSIPSNGGDNLLTGTVKTSLTGARVEIAAAGASGGVARFYSAYATETAPGTVSTWVQGDAPASNAALYLASPKRDVYTQCTLVLQSSDADGAASAAFYVNRGDLQIISTSTEAYKWGGINFWNSTVNVTPWAQIVREGAGARFHSASGETWITSVGAVRISPGASAYVTVPSGGLFLNAAYTHHEGGPLRLKDTWARGISSAAAVGIGSDGTLYHITSSKRYKLKIKDAPLDVAALREGLRPRVFFDRREYDENGKSTDGLQSHLGLIAEEVALIPGLGNLIVPRDEQGRPNEVRYDRVAVALIPWLQDLERRTQKIEEKTA